MQQSILHGMSFYSHIGIYRSAIVEGVFLTHVQIVRHASTLSCVHTLDKRNEFKFLARLLQCGSSNGFGIQMEANTFHNIVTGCTFVNIGPPPSQMHAVVLAGD